SRPAPASAEQAARHVRVSPADRERQAHIVATRSIPAKASSRHRVRAGILATTTAPAAFLSSSQAPEQPALRHDRKTVQHRFQPAPRHKPAGLRTRQAFPATQLQLFARRRPAADHTGPPADVTVADPPAAAPPAWLTPADQMDAASPSAACVQYAAAPPADQKICS